MPGSLYDTDALAWSDRQAELLRRLAGGERLNEAVDWTNVIDEVQDVGLSEVRACQSLLLQAMIHVLKLHAWPASRSGAQWRAEAGVFLDDAAQRFTPSMRQRFDVAGLYATTLRRAGEAADESGRPRPWPAGCPFMLDDQLSGDLGVLGARLDGVAG